MKLIPFSEALLNAGFPTHVDGSSVGLNLHDFLIHHPEATFFVRVQGDSMIGAGIDSGDLLIVDRSLTATDGKVVVALLDGEFTVKRLQKRGEKLMLLAENPLYPPIIPSEGQEFEVWGVVTYAIHCLS